MELCGGELLDKFKSPSHLHLTWVRVSFSSSGRCANSLVCFLSFSNLMLFYRLSHVQCTQTELICLRYLTIQLDSHKIDPHHQKSRPVNYNTWTFLVLELVHVMSFTIWLSASRYTVWTMWQLDLWANDHMNEPNWVYWTTHSRLGHAESFLNTTFIYCIIIYFFSFFLYFI